MNVLLWIIAAVVGFFCVIHRIESYKIRKQNRERRRYEREWQKAQTACEMKEKLARKSRETKSPQQLSNGNSENSVNHSHSAISAQGLRFGESILNDAMIQNEATKMVELFSKQLEHEMVSFYENRNCFTFRYCVGSICISYNPYDELWHRSSAFRDYNVERLTDPYKVEGVAWALQKVAIPQILQKYPSIINSDKTFEACFDYHSFYVSVDFSFEIQLERFRTL